MDGIARFSNLDKHSCWLLTSKRVTTRTGQLTKYCEPLQKMRVRLGPCKTGLSPSVLL